MGLRLRPLHALVPAGALAALAAATAVVPTAGVGSGRRVAVATRGGTPASLAAGAAPSSSAGPGSTAPSSSTTTTVPKGPIELVHGGTVTVAVPYLPSELNPATVAGANRVTAMVMAQVWPSPFMVAGPSNVQASPAFIDSAENVSVSPQTVVYTIDAKARWSNGDPIDGGDFVAEWRAQLALGRRLPATDPLAGYEDIASIGTSPSGKVVTVVFKRPDADWEALFTELAPSRVAARYGWARAFRVASLAHVVSGGPFAIGGYVPGRKLVLARNPAYWGPVPHIQRIVFEVVHGESAILRGLEAGRIDVAGLLPGPALRNALASDSTLRAWTSLTGTLWQVDFNLADKIVGQLAVRRAIATAIDRVELSADSIGLLVPNVPSSGNHLYLIGAPGSTGNDAAYGAVDVPLADGLLGEAGYHVGPGGLLRDATGHELVVDLTVPVGDRLVAEMAAEIRSQLLDAGVVVHLRPTALSRLLASVLPSGAYEMALVPSLVSPFPSENATYYEDPVGPTPVASPFEMPPAPGAATTTTTPPAAPAPPSPIAVAYLPGLGSRTDPGAVRAGSVTRDVTGFDDPVVEGLLERAFSDLNPLTMATLYDEADRHIWSDLPSLPLYQVPKALIATRALLDVRDSPTWIGPLWNAEDWALEVLPPAPPTPTTTPTPSTSTPSTATPSTAPPVDRGGPRRRRAPLSAPHLRAHDAVLGRDSMHLRPRGRPGGGHVGVAE